VSKTLRVAISALIVIVLAAGGSWLYAQVRTLPGTRDLSARSRQRIVTLDVGGMHCDACVTAIRSKLGGVRGVSTVEVRLAQRRAFVVCDPAVSDSALLGAVHAAGPGFYGDVVE
jgi:copper chaperone CopZ